MDKSHTSENVSKILSSAISEWNLQRYEKNPSLTSDNASNIVNGAKQAEHSPHVGCALTKAGDMGHMWSKYGKIWDELCSIYDISMALIWAIALHSKPIHGHCFFSSDVLLSTPMVLLRISIRVGTWPTISDPNIQYETPTYHIRPQRTISDPDHV